MQLCKFKVGPFLVCETRRPVAVRAGSAAEVRASWQADGQANGCATGVPGFRVECKSGSGNCFWPPVEP